MAQVSRFYLENDQYFNPKLELQNSSKKSEVLKFADEFRLTKDQIQKLHSKFTEEIVLGLQSKPARPSAFPMFNTFVTIFPNGKESGSYLGLDIGGTNLRVVNLRFWHDTQKEQKHSFKVSFYDIPVEYRQGECKLFFSYLAECIKKFIDENSTEFEEFLKQKTNQIPLGFTFSFGFEQFAIDRANIVAFGIQTNLVDGIGQDPVKLLQNELDNLKVPVSVVAVANDSTSTLMYGSFLDHEVSVSMILGSGGNVAYVERVENYGKVDDSVKVFGAKFNKVIVNSECVIYGSNNEMDFVKSRYDFELDADSLIPNSYTFEKMIGGAFMGELLRLCLLDLVRNSLLLNGRFTPALVKPGSIQSEQISAIEAEILQNLAKQNSKALDLLERLGYRQTNITNDDIEIVLYISQLITQRCALLNATILSAFVDLIDQKVVKIACDGSVILKHPKMLTMIEAFMECLITKLNKHPNRKAKLILAPDGSSIGAAILAACLARREK